MSRILYPVLTEPVLPPTLQSEQVSEDKWHRPLSDPVGRVGLTTAGVASGLFWSGFAAAPGVDAWHRPLNPPLLPKGSSAGVISSAGGIWPKAAPFAETVTADRWFQSLSQPVVRSRVAEESALSYAYFAPSGAAPTITVVRDVGFYVNLNRLMNH